MAIFKVPKITTEQRASLVLGLSEVVMDVNQNVFYGGDGVTLGGFPLGAGATLTVETITITQQMIQEKKLTLQRPPLYPSKVQLDFVGGIPQLNGIDYEIISGNVLSWDSKGLDNFIEENDVVIISY